MTADRSSPRTELRFDPAAAAPPGLFLLVLNAGALAAGAGAVGFVLRAKDAGVAPYTTEALLVAAVLMAFATYLASSRGMRMRVGPAGIAFEKDDLVRVPWYGLAALTLEDEVLRIRGESVYGAPVDQTCNLHVYRDALAALVAEAQLRAPALVTDALVARVGAARSNVGTAVALEPALIAGRRCAASGKIVAVETDGLVCARCERVYLKSACPKACACGAPLP